MVDVIDQTWVPEWAQRFATKAESLTMKKWLKEAPPEWHAILQRLPPMCIVRGTLKNEVPFPYSIGIVTGYLEGDRVLVRQEPSSEDVSVPAGDLTVVGYWSGLTPDVVRRILPRRKPVHAQHR
jgi:hypothetical protein